MRLHRAGPLALLTALWWAWATMPVGLAAQAVGTNEVGTGDTVGVTPNPVYAAGPLHRVLFGTDYRRLWTSSVAVSTTNLARLGGGLTPLSAGGGRQTKSLWFRGADGYVYGFRSVDKDPAILGPEFANTFIEDLVKDQMSSQFPFAPAVTAPLMEAVGILHTDPKLTVLPDGALLGKYRERFAGTLGFIERRATVEPGLPGFAGAIEIIESPELFARVRGSTADRMDARAFLAARLFDLLVGDWDRHRDQWTWARFTDGPIRWWTVIPEDRDQAFVRFDGLMLGIARLGAPFLLNFGPSYGSIVGATWTGRELDRGFLGTLERSTWDSVTAAFVARLPDAVIEAAVGRLPSSVNATDSARMVAALRARRDALPRASRAFYSLLAREAEVHATDEADRVVIDSHPDRTLTVTIGAAGDPIVHRTFDPAETREIRVFLHRGADRVVARGVPTPTITVRLIGGGGAAVLADSIGGVRFYATAGDSAAGPARSHVDRRPDPGGPPPTPPLLPYRDWGSLWMATAWFGMGPDVGLFLGGGAYEETFGFRRFPYKSRYSFRGGWAFGAHTGRADLDVTTHRENSHLTLRIHGRLSGIDIVRYNGLGNDVVVDLPNVYYRVRQAQALFAPQLNWTTGPLGLGLGPALEYVHTRTDSNRVIAATQPPGSGTFGQLGVRGSITLDTRDLPAYASRGVMIRIEAAVVPAVWDVASTYGWVEGAASTYLTAGGVPFQPTLALRAGGRSVWGPYPYFAASFLGDERTARLGNQNRYGGDAAVFGNAELRLRLTRFFVILPGELGAFGLADAGRVFLDGETSTTWHHAFGGGLWISLLERRALLSGAIAATPDRTAFYLTSGMTF